MDNYKESVERLATKMRTAFIDEIEATKASDEDLETALAKNIALYFDVLSTLLGNSLRIAKKELSVGVARVIFEEVKQGINQIIENDEED